MVEVDPANYWLFGYGSLIFKAPPHTVERVQGYVTGSVRRFWQSSNDHRGTPEAPGRVVTLITKEYWETLHDPHPYGNDDVVYGVAYRIDPAHATEVKEYMDWREKNGYVDVELDFYSTDSGSHWKCITYVGTPGNDAFVGPQDPEELAKHIAHSSGPSGANIEYLENLDRALRLLHPEHKGDLHITDLVERAQKYLDR